MDYKKTIDFIRALFPKNDKISLHAPLFQGNEKKYLERCIDTTFVSYVGEFVTQFEKMTAEFVGAKYACAMSNGTLALHIALIVSGVKSEHEVLTQALTFVATCNAISYTGAKCVFIDSDPKNLGLSYPKLKEFLENKTYRDEQGFTRNKKTQKIIKACVPMHVFGHSVEIDKICTLCKDYNITVIEDSAESLGSYYNNKHTGTYGEIGILSFNGNKIIPTGGGGMLITDNVEIANKAKYLSTTAKRPHPFEFFHDELGYNYRLSNLNAAVGCAQMEVLDTYIKNKRELAQIYADFFKKEGIRFLIEPENSRSNYWLNAVILEDRLQRDEFLKITNENGVMTRPIWTLMNKLPMYQDCENDGLETALWFEDRVVNIPSSVRFPV